MIYELRQYTLRAGLRDVLVELFEREFLEGQERAGMRVVGQFRDLRDPDRFVWLRRFEDMDGRARALAAFYDGPVWQEHRDAANGTMVDSDDVLLLRVVGGEERLLAVGAGEESRAVYVATLHHFDDAVPGGLAERAGDVVGCWSTEYAANNFPRLPVRTGEHVFVSLARFDDAAQAADQAPELVLSERAEQVFLAPTARSLLR